MLKLLLPVLLGLCFLCPGARALPADAYVAVNIPARYMVSLDALASYIRANYTGGFSLAVQSFEAGRTAEYYQS